MRTFNTGIHSFALMAAASALPLMMAADDAGGVGNEFSLADLADLDVSDIAEIRFEQLSKGIYVFECIEAELHEGTDGDGAKRFHAEFVDKIVEVKSVLEPNVDKDSLIGKTITTKLYIHPGKEQEKVLKAIGRLRAHVADRQVDSTGKLGDIVRNCKGEFHTSKIVGEKDQNDKTIEYSKLRLDPPKKK